MYSFLRVAVVLILSASLFYSPIFALRNGKAAVADDSSTLIKTTKTQQRELTPDIQLALRAGANLDLLRNNRPQRPAPYQPIGTLPGAEQTGFKRVFEFLTGSLPGANYDDPKPAITANYNAYLTELSKATNAAGPAGSQPMQTVDPTAGTASVGGFSYNLDSRNYNFLAPVMGLAGRAGFDLSLALSYNSNVWVRDTASNTVAFNADRGFPAPGWRLGFGAIQIHTNTTGAYSNGVTGQSSIIYIAPDGTRRDMALIPGTSKYKTYDSSYIVFDAAVQIMYFPNGTQAKYGSAGYSYDPSNYDFQALPIEIKDRNGNFITINYKTLNCGSNGLKTVIDFVTDTAGRRVDFNYQNNRLTSISQTRGSSTFSYVNIDYDPVTIQTNFPAAQPQTRPPSTGRRSTFPSGSRIRPESISGSLTPAMGRSAPSRNGRRQLRDREPSERSPRLPSTCRATAHTAFNTLLRHSPIVMNGPRTGTPEMWPPTNIPTTAPAATK